MEENFKKSLESLSPYALSAVVINLGTLAGNYHKVRSELKPGTVAAGVVKANAYGFGAVRVAERLYREGCRNFFVASIEEGLEVRTVLPRDAEIFILAGILKGGEGTCFENKLTPILNSIGEVNLWTSFCKRLGHRVPAAIQVDTGMVRNGLSLNDVELNHGVISENIDIAFVMSHLACPDEPKHYKNSLQLERFKKVLKYFDGDRDLEQQGPVKASFSATNGIFLGSEYQFDIVRPGKALYGFSVREDLIGTFEPVMDIFARVVQINEISPGETIGYGATFTAERSMRTATLGIGYADGFMRKFAGFGQAFIGGHRVPMVGRISMDYSVVDVTDLDLEVSEKYLKVGEWVALTHFPECTLERWALEMDTLPHEVACRFGRRVHKVYLEN